MCSPPGARITPSCPQQRLTDAGTGLKAAACGTEPVDNRVMEEKALGDGRGAGRIELGFVTLTCIDVLDRVHLESRIRWPAHRAPLTGAAWDAMTHRKRSGCNDASRRGPDGRPHQRRVRGGGQTVDARPFPAPVDPRGHGPRATPRPPRPGPERPVSYTHLRAHETR